jgi:hypothetical protein
VPVENAVSPSPRMLSGTDETVVGNGKSAGALGTSTKAKSYVVSSLNFKVLAGLYCMDGLFVSIVM